jgi:shikimate kinase / 3-dehydroquinate synthase
VNLERTIEVATPSRTYPVVIGAGTFERRELWRRYGRASSIAIVTNKTVAPLFLERLCAVLEPLQVPVISVALDDGEPYKTWASASKIFDALMAARCDRDTLIVALGGGVVGDLAGFVAATYQRGVDFIQIPTTLLALVDSSVGGKTAINHPAGKNMIGAFHQPRAVFADTGTLQTLPLRELRAGIAEVIKHGAMASSDLFVYLEANMGRLLSRDSEALLKVIEDSVLIKADIVGCDERESGERALLNFGHTFGHAIEQGLGFGTWLHGEAVGAGMVLAAKLSVHLGMLDPSGLERVEALVTAAGLPITPPDFAPATWVDLMSGDKKARGGEMRFVVLEGIGRARVVKQDARQVLNFLAAAGLTEPA